MRNAIIGVATAMCLTACGGGTTDPGTSKELTLSNCTTSIAADVPEFFKTYFTCVTMSVSGTDVVISTKGLPPHKSYYYGKSHPNYEEFDSSRGSAYRPNPNTLKELNVTVRVPLNPTPKSGLSITPNLIDGQTGNSLEYKMGSAGVALNSVILFNPLAAPGDDIEQEKYTFDSYNAHPAPNGAYHYHTQTKGPLEVLSKLGLVTQTTPNSAEIELYGIMCDGTVVMGCTELDGSEPVRTDFDAQNGHVHDLKSKQGSVLLSNRYHTHLCTKWSSNNRQYTPEIQYYTTCSAN